MVNGNLRLGRLQTAVRTEYKTGKGYEQLNQESTVSRLFGNLDYGMCVRNAETLLAWDRQDVHDWVKGASALLILPITVRPGATSRLAVRRHAFVRPRGRERSSG